MKKIALLVFILGSLSTQAQDFKKFKFGVQASPFISWMHSNSKEVDGAGVNIGINFGMMGEYYFAENYALTGGIGYLLNKGGKLKYNQEGDHLPRSAFGTDLTTALGTRGDTLWAGTTIARRINYVQIPFGFKMRTNELGENSFLRIYAHLPYVCIDIATSARGDVINEGVPGSPFNKETIYKDIIPIGMTIGGGAGIEYYPNDKDLTLTAGIYYNGGIFDMTKDGDQQNAKTKGALSDVTIRIGVLF